MQSKLFLKLISSFQIEKTETGAQDKPKKDVVIAAAGHIPVETPFSVDKTDAV